MEPNDPRLVRHNIAYRHEIDAAVAFFLVTALALVVAIAVLLAM